MRTGPIRGSLPKGDGSNPIVGVAHPYVGAFGRAMLGRRSPERLSGDRKHHYFAGRDGRQEEGGMFRSAPDVPGHDLTFRILSPHRAPVAVVSASSVGTATAGSS